MTEFFESLEQHLNNKQLLLSDAFIAGEWIKSSSSGERFDVRNPSTGDVIVSLPDMGRKETRTAIDAAYTAQKNWVSKTGKERAAVLRKWSDNPVEHVSSGFRSRTSVQNGSTNT